MRGLSTHIYVTTKHTDRTHTLRHKYLLYNPISPFHRNAKYGSTPLGVCSVKSLSSPKLLVKRTKLENKTVQLTNKITCCLHLVEAIKALMTSKDGLLMWCLKAYQHFRNKIAPHVPLWQHSSHTACHSLVFLCCPLYSVWRICFYLQ